MRKRIFTLFLALLMLLCACRKVDPNLHLDKDGDPLQGFHILEGKKQYLRDGYIQTGWLTVDGQTYFADTTGIRTGWLTQDGVTYYFNDLGQRQTGWMDLDGYRYLLDENGKMLTGWLENDEGRKYFDPDGKLHIGWLATEEGNYYFDDQGNMVRGWLKLEDGTYYMDEEGLPVIGSMEMDGHKYLFNPDGTAYVGWLEENGERYYYLPGGKMAIGEVKLDGKNYHFTSKGKYVLLVNNKNAVPDDYKATIVSYNGIQMEQEALTHLKEMIKAGKAKGCTFNLNYGYRSIATQQSIWDKHYKAFRDAGYSHAEATRKTDLEVSKAGYSEHQTGLAADVGSTTWESYYFMEDHGWKYGFIVRYPEGKESYTGIKYEPWHVRYVGVELAKELHDLDMCMEEYMEMLTAKQ